jgi:hypothetical protein
MSLAILALGLIGEFNRPVAIAMVLLGLGMAVVAIVKRRPKFSPHVGFAHWPWLLMTPSLAMVVLCALLPAGLLWGMDEPNGYDVVEYHLQVPREWYEAGHIFALHHNVYSFFPFNVEMHYLLGMQLMGGPWAGQFLAQLMHAAYMALFVVAVYATVRPWGQGRAMIAALLAAAPPWVPLLASIAYDEGGLLLYGTLAIGWAMRGLNDERGTMNEEVSAVHRSSFIVHRFLLSGVMAGFAAGCKLTAVPLILAGIPVAVMLLAPRQWKGVAVFSLAGLLTFSPWLMRNAVWARGNPVFPEMQSVLGRAHFSQEQSDRWYRAHKPRPEQQAMKARVEELKAQVFADWRFGPVVNLLGHSVGLGMLSLGILAMLNCLKHREPRMLLLLMVILTGFWLLETHLQGRFYVLAIPLAAIATTFVPKQWWRLVVAPVAVLLVIVGVGMACSHLESTEIDLANRGIPLMAAVGFTDIDRSQQLHEPLPSMPIVLVGDAQAFTWKVPMSQLHYRTIFDVDMSDGRTASEAYAADLPLGTTALFWIDPGELARFERTYQLPARRDFWTDMPNLPMGSFPMQWTVGRQ